MRRRFIAALVSAATLFGAVTATAAAPVEAQTPPKDPVVIVGGFLTGQPIADIFYTGLANRLRDEAKRRGPPYARCGPRHQAGPVAEAIRARRAPRRIRQTGRHVAGEDRGHFSIAPRSTGSETPVMYRASLDSRNRTAFATSSGSIQGTGRVFQLR